VENDCALQLEKGRIIRTSFEKETKINWRKNQGEELKWKGQPPVSKRGEFVENSGGFLDW